MSLVEFFDCPKLYIDEYYREKINQVDLKCEQAILDETGQEEKICLNLIREKLINKIRSVKQAVMERLELLESKNTLEKCGKYVKGFKDDVFNDQYCLVFDAYELYPIFEFKCGVLIFSQYNDDLIKNYT